jgi:hypothetical protein
VLLTKEVLYNRLITLLIDFGELILWRTRSFTITSASTARHLKFAAALKKHHHNGKQKMLQLVRRRRAVKSCLVWMAQKVFRINVECVWRGRSHALLHGIFHKLFFFYY